MPVTLKSTEAQQNFGAMLDMALGENDVIVERYGTPRIAFVAYNRYQDLVDAERELMRIVVDTSVLVRYLLRPSAATRQLIEGL